MSSFHRCYDEYVFLPRDEEEKRSSVSAYSRMGLPGAIGSTDCVHVRSSWLDPALDDHEKYAVDDFHTLLLFV